MFGKLISDGGDDDVEHSEGKKEEADGLAEGDVDLKEHMVSILFSRSKLSHLQKQVGQPMLHLQTSIQRNNGNGILTQAATPDELQITCILISLGLLKSFMIYLIFRN